MIYDFIAMVTEYGGSKTESLRNFTTMCDNLVFSFETEKTAKEFYNSFLWRDFDGYELKELKKDGIRMSVVFRAILEETQEDNEETEDEESGDE